MSDLAPFVAAALRDRTMAQLMQELAEKEQIIKEMFKVEITGPNGTPVYAEGKFDEGGYGPQMHNLFNWFPQLKHRLDCPLTELRGVEVRLGGVVQFTLDPEHDQKVDIEIDFEAAFHATIAPDDGSRLQVNIHGWREDDWRPMIDDDDDAWDENAAAALDYFDSLPNLQDCKVTFEALGFSVEKYEAMIEKLPRSEERQRRREEQLHSHYEYDIALSDRMEAEGIEEEAKRALDAFMTLALDIYQIDEEFEQVFPPLVEVSRLHEEQGYTEDEYCAVYRELERLLPSPRLLRDNENRSEILQDFVTSLEEMIQQQMQQMDDSA